MSSAVLKIVAGGGGKFEVAVPSAPGERMIFKFVS